MSPENSLQIWMVATSLAIGGSLALMLYGTLLVVRRRALRVRLATIAGDAPALHEVAGSGPRGLAPLLIRLGQALARLLPSRVQARLLLASVQAGCTGSSTVHTLLAARTLIILIGGLAAYALATSGRGALGTIGALLVGGLALFGLDLYLRSRAKGRQRSADRDLPTVLDLLTLTLAAGLGFDNALEMILDSFDGPLSQELTRYLLEIRTLGARRTVALREVALRLGDPPDLIAFVEAVNRAQQMGTGLLAAVESQVGILRQERHRRVASAAQRAPVRMLIPMTLFMLPVLMLIVLAPVGLRVMNASGGLH